MCVCMYLTWFACDENELGGDQIDTCTPGFFEVQNRFEEIELAFHVVVEIVEETPSGVQLLDFTDPIRFVLIDFIIVNHNRDFRSNFDHWFLPNDRFQIHQSIQTIEIHSDFNIVAHPHSSYRLHKCRMRFIEVVLQISSTV